MLRWSTSRSGACCGARWTSGCIHEIETVEGLLQPMSWTPQGVRTPGGASPLDDDDDRWLQVWSRDGRLLFQSDVARTQPIAALTTPGADAARSLDDGRSARARQG